MSPIGFPAMVEAAPIVHPGDTLAVNVLNYDALVDDEQGTRYKGLQADSVIVTGDGSISLPVIGVVHVAGDTTKQIASHIEARLSDYVREPAVSVQIIQQAQQLFLTGATVGTLTYLPGETLATALGQLREQSQKDVAPEQAAVDKNGATFARSGIDLRKISIERDGTIGRSIDGEALLRDGLPGPPLEPGDTLVFVDKPIRVNVSGEVVAPGPIYLYPEDTLEQALLSAGGPLDNASNVDVSLMRNGMQSPLPLAGREIRQAPEDGDSIIVRAAPHVSVLGQVNTPGDLKLKNGSGLLVALYLAGGPTRWANVKDVEVIHQGIHQSYNLEGLQHGDLKEDFPLSDGDVVYVPEGHKIDARLFFQGLLGALGSVYDVSHL